ncbi:MAG: alpha/beta fold hydrolase [Anaeromyxobacteraceae bacterium]
MPLAALAAALLLAAPPAPPLPAGSRLVPVRGASLHVRTLGADHPGPAVVLLSGPTGHWHADSGWFALLQPLLARSHRVHAIDRPGQAFSPPAADGSYRRLGDDLAALLPALEREPVVVVAFASANLALHRLLAAGGARHVRAALLIDPDALHPDLVRFYADQAQPFADQAALRAYVEAGKYDARAEGFRTEELREVRAMVPAEVAAAMDWPYYEAVARLRADRAHVLARFAETARYGEDVEAAAAVPWPAGVPVWSLDTDFEAADAARARDPAERAKLERWRALSTAFMAGLPGGCRIASTSQEHLAVVAEAPRVAALVEGLLGEAPCPARP